MKTRLFYSIWILLSFMNLSTSCSDDEPAFIPHEMYDILMFVTNDANEDLVLKSDKYYHYTNTFSFNSWEIYLDGRLIQTGDNENRFYEKNVNYQQYTDVDRKNIRLDSNKEIQKHIDDSAQKHVAEFIVSSPSLFGDAEKHTIRMEFRKVENEYGYLTLSEFSVSVDGVAQEVFYPEHWEGMTPKSQYASIIYPYFVLNVDTILTN